MAELPEEPSFKIKPEDMQRAKEMIARPELPIARVWVRGDVEGKSSIDLGWMNGYIEDILRVTVPHAIHAPVSGGLQADREISLSLYTMDEAVREIANELPGHDLKKEVRKSMGGKDVPPLVRLILPQENIGSKVAAFVSYTTGKKERLKDILKPGTEFNIIPTPPTAHQDQEIGIIHV